MHPTFLKKIYLFLLTFLFLIVFAIFYLYPVRIKIYKVDVEYKPLHSIKDIEPIKDTLIKPIVYTNTISLKALPLAAKKRKFIDLLLPAILVAKFNVEQERILVQEYKKRKQNKKALKVEDRLFLSKLYLKYSVKSLENLEAKMKSHPTSIVLGQAALESGWGTSDFYLKGNNIFGIWASKNSRNKIKARATRNGKPIYLRKYKNLSESIEDYYLTIAKGKAYKKFRQERIHSEQPYTLIEYLDQYSELRGAYAKRLRRVMRQNNLTRYDNYLINPKYILTVSQDRFLLGSIKR